MPGMHAQEPLSAPATAPAPASGIPWRLVLTAWALIEMLMLSIWWRSIPGMQVRDTDDALRLVQVRDLLGGQGWFDLHQYRIMAPEGILMHWSRLVDLPLAALIVALRPLVGTHAAELATMVIIPALTLLGALGVLMSVSYRLFGRDTAVTAGILVGLCAPILSQMQPLRIDHHGWQILAALGAMAALHARPLHAHAPRLGAWVMGLCLAVELTISLEGLPVAVLFMGALALRGLRSGRWTDLARATQALALGLVVLFLATRAIGDLAEHCDQVSPMHMAALVWIALCCGVLARLNTAKLARPWLPALAILTLAALGGAAITLVAAPQCAGGAFGGMDPFVRREWLDNVAESQPLWHYPLITMAGVISSIPVGLWGCWWLIRTSQGEERWRWLEHGLVLVGAVALGTVMARAMGAAAALAILPASALVYRWRQIAVRQSSTWARLGITLLTILTIYPTITALAASAAWNRLAAKDGAKKDGKDEDDTCGYIEGLAPLNAMPVTDIFEPIDIGPQILLRTRQRVVATGHHRGVAAIGDVMHAFLARPDQAQAYVRKRHATLVVICTTMPEMKRYQKEAPQGLAAALLAGKPPVWLRPLPQPGADKTHIAIWQVRPN